MIDLYSPRDFLNPRTINLEQLLGEHFFEVPAYQRNYAWRDGEEVRQLWQDILLVFDRSWLKTGLPVGNPRPHFFGPIVVQQSEDDPGTFEVMDGQQRLVTFSILVSILKELSNELADPEHRNNWTGTLSKLLSVHVSGNLRPRLKLGRSSDHFVNMFCAGRDHDERIAYAEEVKGLQSPEVTSMISAYKVLHVGVAEFLAERLEDQEALIQLNRTVIGLSLFLLMSVKQPNAAYEVFEGLNARGRELSQADLIKNKLFSKAEPEGTLDLAQKNWEATYTAINGQSMVDMPTFLQLHHWVYYGVVKATELYDVVANSTLGTTSNITARDYSVSVRNAAERLQRTLDAGSSFEDDATHDIEGLRDVFSNKFALLLVIASTEHYALESASYKEVLRLAHRFVFRRFIVGDASLSVYSNELAEVSWEFRANGDLTMLKDNLRSKSSDSTFVSNFREAKARTNKEGFYVCEMIERHLGSDSGMLPNRQSPSQHLEHIYPRNPKPGEWPQVDKDELALYINRFGNLLVLEADINRSIKNSGYSHKVSNSAGLSYLESGLKLPKTLSKYEVDGSWTFDSIVSRQADLATLYAGDVWSL